MDKTKAVLKDEYDIVLKAHGLPSYKSIKRLFSGCAKDNSRQTKLQWATCNDDAEQAVELVLNDGAAINARGADNDYTVLMQASRSSSSQFIETLIDLGADVNAKTEKRKETPLKLAAVWNNYMAVCLLVRHGTDVNVQDSYGFTPLHVSVRKGRENLIKLLLANKVDVNIQDEHGYTPLHFSVKERNENLCRLLLEHNADVNIQDRYGNKPLDWCAGEGKENLCRLLREHNAMQRHPKFELSSGQKAIETKYTTGVASVQGAEKRKSNFKSEKTVRHHKSKATTSSRTKKCVMA